ncbi:hypothetical protein BIY23_01750 [Wolbachia pipientis]|uniref:Uncharacterized protein n=1 Tax=Wolbachia pipientis TaxID=955 RepID=A0A1E7QL20_WOLPI|nr:hypothetical protein BIY23_01750 [Wolbachia pipientis]
MFGPLLHNNFGNSFGNIPHWQPLFKTYNTPQNTSHLPWFCLLSTRFKLWQYDRELLFTNITWTYILFLPFLLDRLQVLREEFAHHVLKHLKIMIMALKNIKKLLIM